MENLPEEILIKEILLKLPAKTVSNLRYVSKYFLNLITNPSFIKSHLHHTTAQLNNHSLVISTYQLVLCTYTRRRFGVKPVIHNYNCNFLSSTSSARARASTCTTTAAPEIVEMHCPFESNIEIRGSCNGLLYLHNRLFLWIDGKKNEDISNYIWNPCTNEYKELPPPPPPLLLNGVDVGNVLLNGFSSTSGFCGFGYDHNNDEYKILHYENRIDLSYIDLGHDLYRINLVSSIIEFNLYTLGTNTWKRIADNPYGSFYFKEPSKRIGLLVNGALHWIMSLSDPASKGKIISFDFEKEVFREVQKPCYYSMDEEEEEHNYDESLQVLQECLCMCQLVHSHGGEVIKIDIWMLQDYDVMDSWTKLFRVVIPDKKFGFNHFRLLRYCENGEIVMLRNVEDVIVYDPVNHKARCVKKFNESIGKSWRYYLDYTESLVCLNSGTYYTYRAS